MTAKCFLKLEFLEQTAIKDMIGQLKGKPKLVRNAKLLGQQFDYRYGITEDEEGGAYLVEFGGGVINFTITVHLSEASFQNRQVKEPSEVV